MRTRMHQLPHRYLQIFYAIQKVLQREMLQNSPYGDNVCVKHHHTSKQTSFINPATLQTQPLQTNLRKPHLSLTLIILPAPLLITTPITKRATPITYQSNPCHQDAISVGSTLLYNHPPTVHNTTARIIS